MDIDDNDLLYTNVFISKPELNSEIPVEFNEEFKKYYEEQINNKEQKEISSKVELDDDFLDQFDNIEIKNNSTKRLVKEVKTYISIDSRDRDKKLYPKPNYFKLFLGKSFYNVKMIKMVTIEFPNINAVINSFNNKIYWRNKEDIDNNTIAKTGEYPIYSIELRVGNYSANNLQTEMAKSLNLVQRDGGLLPDVTYHYFVPSLDIYTDLSSFTSLKLKELGSNPISLTRGSNEITVSLPNTSGSTDYSLGESIYIIGAQTTGGVPETIINGRKKIIGVTNTSIRYEINLNANENITDGGGSNIKIGKDAAFQFLFGEYSDTIAQNLGFPLENSSLKINTNVSNIQPFYQLQITTQTPHTLTESFDYIGQDIAIIDNTGTTLDDKTYIISKIIDSTNILIKITESEKQEFLSDIISITTGVLGFVNTSIGTLNIENISVYNADCIYLECDTIHNYSFSDVGVGKNVNIYDANTIPNINGDNVLFSVLSENEMIILGKIYPENSNDLYSAKISQYKVLTTKTIDLIDSIIINPNQTTTFIFESIVDIDIGDKIKIFNLDTTPACNNTYTVLSVIGNTVTVNLNISTINTLLEDYKNIIIGTGIMTLSLPNHGFNKIVSITQNSTGPFVNILTQLPHNFVDSSKITIRESNSEPSIDGEYNVVSAGNNSFSIPFTKSINTPGDNGILDLNQEFYIYNADGLGGIEDDNINNIKFKIKEIIDANNFTFLVNNSYATKDTFGGGNNVYISSLRHGFNGEQNNLKNDNINRSINLEGENYAFLCCPQLSSMMNTSMVEDVFARISLDKSPGNVVFGFLSNPKKFDDAALNYLGELELSIKNWDNKYYEFNDLDYSFVLEITELKDTTENFNISSRRGVTDVVVD